MLGAFAPEQRLADLSAEEQLLALSNEVLRGLPASYLATLSPAVQSTIQARLALPAPPARPGSPPRRTR